MFVELQNYINYTENDQDAKDDSLQLQLLLQVMYYKMHIIGDHLPVDYQQIRHLDLSLNRPSFCVDSRSANCNKYE